MDFPDLTEYIGPIIFGLIAWLSNYFSKKKKPSDGIEKDIKKKEGFQNDLTELYNKIVSPEKDEEVREEINLSSEINDKILNKEISDKAEIVNNIREETNIINEDIIETGKDDIESRKKNNKIDKRVGDTATTHSNNVKERIKSKNGLKEAFILKEILERKYD